VTEHMCDVCSESPAMTYNEKQGAVCNDCRLYDADGNCVCNDSGCDFCNPVVESDCDDGDDAYALASAGWGTDEDYGYYGDE